jgi:predicted nucleotidyltransferase
MLDHLARLKAAHPSIAEVWLIGSRANGTSKCESDWDFIVFGPLGLREAMAQDKSLARPDVDLLVASPDGVVADPWKVKSGTLSNWEWNRISNSQATYIGRKSMPDEEAATEGFPNMGHIKEDLLSASLVDL